jgi:hypothetical protein
MMMAETNIDPLMVNISPMGRKNQMPFAGFSIEIFSNIQIFKFFLKLEMIIKKFSEKKFKVFS